MYVLRSFTACLGTGLNLPLSSQKFWWSSARKTRSKKWLGVLFLDQERTKPLIFSSCAAFFLQLLIRSPVQERSTEGNSVDWSWLMRMSQPELSASHLMGSRADLKAIAGNRCYFLRTDFISGWPGSMSVALLHPQQVTSNKLGRE